MSLTNDQLFVRYILKVVSCLLSFATKSLARSLSLSRDRALSKPNQRVELKCWAALPGARGAEGPSAFEAATSAVTTSSSFGQLF